MGSDECVRGGRQTQYPIMCTHVSGVRMSVSLQSGFCDNTVYMYYQRRVRVLFVQRVGRACSVTVQVSDVLTLNLRVLRLR
jgi:hypothetical protein